MIAYEVHCIVSSTYVCAWILIRDWAREVIDPIFLHKNEIGSSYKIEHIQKQFNLQLEQQEKVFLYDFQDPMNYYLESLSTADVKPFFFSGCWFCYFFELHFFMPWIYSFFQSRSRVSLVNQFLAWIHWKTNYDWWSNNSTD